MNRMLEKMASALCRCIDGLLLIAWLGAVDWLLLTGNDTAFLHPRFRLFLTGGTAILGTFILVILSGPQRRETGWQLAVTTVHALVLMVPLLFLTSVIGQGMGAHALTKKYKGVEQQTLTRLLESGKAKRGESSPIPGRAVSVLLMERIRNRQTSLIGDHPPGCPFYFFPAANYRSLPGCFPMFFSFHQHVQRPHPCR